MRGQNEVQGHFNQLFDSIYCLVGEQTGVLEPIFQMKNGRSQLATHYHTIIKEGLYVAIQGVVKLILIFHKVVDQ